jgi:hypothetical protein
VWRIEKYEVNGIDSTDFILNNPNYADMKFEHTDNGKDAEGNCLSGSFIGFYDFQDQETINIAAYDTIAQSKNVFFVRDKIHPFIQFHVTYLSHNHFWVKADYYAGGSYNYTYNQNNYYIKFKNVK